jgi:hypothetical protein
VLDAFFQNLFTTTSTEQIVIGNFLLCLISALAIGAVAALFYMYKNSVNKNFLITLALLPAVVCLVIMMVKGNIGAGVAVAGAFSLVRFRSVPGTAKEICAIFIAMAAGLASGMGYPVYGGLFVLIVGCANLIYLKSGFGGKTTNACDKTYRITIPEDLDYTGVFDDLFAEYTGVCELIKIKTTNMGSLFRLTYNLTLKDVSQEKEFIDKLRCRNGNLEISSSKQEAERGEL